MDPPSVVAEYLSLDRENFRLDIGAMEKSVEIPDARSGDFVMLMRADSSGEVPGRLETCLRSEFMVQVVGLKRKRDDFDFDSDSVDLDDESISMRKHASSLVEERIVPIAPADCKIDLTLDSETDDDCIITGFVMPQVTLPGAEYEFRDSEFIDELRASEADDDEFTDSEYSVESVPASLSARESDDGFTASESDDGSSAWGFEEEFSPVPEWNADDAILWGWFDARR